MRLYQSQTSPEKSRTSLTWQQSADALPAVSQPPSECSNDVTADPGRDRVVFAMCPCLSSFQKLEFLALPVVLIAVQLDEMFFKLVLMLTPRLGDVAFCQAGRCLIMSH